MKINKPDFLHFFDSHSFNIYFPFLYILRYKTVVNKCGGPNPSSYPVVSNLILFSEENKNWFQKRIEYTNTKLTVIPNRVSTIKVQKYIEYKKDEKITNFVRICRIGKTYYNSILNGINLIKELTQNGDVNVKLFIVGKIVDLEEYNSLKKLSKGFNIEFITEDKYTIEASRMLYLADIVIGTGRSAMEAFSLSLPVLVPSKQFIYPVLVNSGNFKVFSDKNFTERTRIENTSSSFIINEIINLIHDNELYQECSNFSKKMFIEHFDIIKVPNKYIDFYMNSNSNSFNLKSLRINTRRYFSTTLRMFLSQF